MDDIPSECRVVPFGNLRIKGYLHLPEAYRSLSRPSSPPRAKASAMRPCLLSFKRFILVLVLVVECFLLSILHTRTRTVWYILLALTKILLFVHHVKDRFSFQRLWRITDSNRWPSACKADALASWANPPRGYQEFCFLAFSFRCSSFLSLVVPGRVELPTSTLSV